MSKGRRERGEKGKEGKERNYMKAMTMVMHALAFWAGNKASYEYLQ